MFFAEKGNGELFKKFNETIEKVRIYGTSLDEASSDEEKKLYRNLIVECDKTMIELVKLAGCRETSNTDLLTIEFLKIQKEFFGDELKKTTDKWEREFYSTRLEVMEKGLNEIEVYKLEQKKLSQDILVAQIASDPLSLDKNERIAYELIKKTGILIDEGRKAFEEKIASGDEPTKKDALALEKALAKAGYRTFTVDGSITDKTIAAAKTLIGENTVAINNYEQTLKTLGEALSSSSQKIEANANFSSTELSVNATQNQIDFILQGDAKELFEAYKGFVKSGEMSAEKIDGLSALDDKKVNASIQLIPNGAVIVDASGKSTKIIR